MLLMHFISMPAGLRKHLSMQKYPLGGETALKAFLLSRNFLSEVIVQHIVLFLGCDALEMMNIVLRKLGKAAFSSYEKIYKTSKHTCTSRYKVHIIITISKHIYSLKIFDVDL